MNLILSLILAAIIGAIIVAAIWSIHADKQAEKIEQDKIKAYFRGYEDGRTNKEPNYPHP